MKSQQPVAPGVNLAGPAQVVKHTTYHSYTEAEIVDLTKQFQQRAGESLAVWLLCLWDLEVVSIMCTDNDMEKLASIMTRPFL